MNKNLAKLIHKDLHNNMRMPISACIFLSLLIPVLFTMAPTSLGQASLPGELFLPLLAIFGFGTIFLPEQGLNIATVINCKQTQLVTIYFIRFITSCLLFGLIAGVIVIKYHLTNSPVAILTLWTDFSVKIILIGTLAVFAFGLFKTLAATYLLPTVFFALCLGSTHLGPLTLFTLSKGRDPRENVIQLFVALILFAIGLFEIHKQQLEN